MVARKSGLGRSLNELLGDSPKVSTRPVAAKDGLKNLPVEYLQRGVYQPRQEIDESSLLELAESIEAQGIIQPIVVRPITDHKYEIIAGERRWRAAQLAGLAEVPVVIRELDDEATMAMALIENIQREDLNPMEEARALQRLVDEFQLSHQEVATSIGKSRTAVTNTLRLNQLHHDVQKLLENGDIEMGHARAILALPQAQQVSVARMVSNKSFTVRQTEQYVRNLLGGEKKEPEKTENSSADIRQLENKLSDQLGAKVILQHQNKGNGKLIIHYNSSDELEGILEHIS